MRRLTTSRNKLEMDLSRCPHNAESLKNYSIQLIFLIENVSIALLRPLMLISYRL